MNLLSLNIQSGATGQKFTSYIKQKTKTVDVFCFQEVFDSKKSALVWRGGRTDIYKKLKKLLKGYNNIFFPVSTELGKTVKVKYKITLGLAIFYKNTATVNRHFGRYLSGALHDQVDFKKGKETNAVQVANISFLEGDCWVLNFHGASRPGDKLDTPKRIKQSKSLVRVFKKLKGPKILCGDFNLMPSTKSIKMIEDAGMKNLIKIYKIKNTRNSISWKRNNNRQSYADFTFVSKEVSVKDFKVPYTLVSDHLPMVTSFNFRTMGLPPLDGQSPTP